MNRKRKIPLGIIPEEDNNNSEAGDTKRRRNVIESSLALQTGTQNNIQTRRTFSYQRNLPSTSTGIYSQSSQRKCKRRQRDEEIDEKNDTNDENEFKDLEDSIKRLRIQRPIVFSITSFIEQSVDSVSFNFNNDGNIRALAKLLKSSENEADEDSRDRKIDFESEDEDNSNMTQITPGTIGIETKSKNNTVEVEAKISSNSTSSNGGSKMDKNCIWTQGEVGENFGDSGNIKVPDVSNDPRKKPEVSCQLRQDLKTEDVFLRMGNKIGGSESCEWIVLKINLKGEKSSDSFNLDVKEKWIEFRSDLYLLIYPLPYPVNPREGNAKWDKESCHLILNLKISRSIEDVFNL